MNLMRITAILFIFLVNTASAKSNSNVEKLYQEAKTGKPAAQLAYAKAIYPDSHSGAFKWATAAGQQGLAEAWFWLGENTTENSIDYYEKAAQLDYAPAYSIIVDHYLLGGSNANYLKAKKYADIAKQKNIMLGFNEDDGNEKIQTINHCLQAGPVTLPSSDRPTLQQVSQYRQVDCDIYQYAIGVKQDFNQYRQCLLAQNEIDNVSLAELYANGWGVKRNPLLALALVCYAEGLAPAELYGMVDSLYQTRSLGKLSKAFTFCEHITSGANMTLCAARDEKISMANYNATFSQLITKWPVPDVAAFKKLQETAEAFFDEHATSELDMSGTARGAIAISEKETLRRQFLNDLLAFEIGRLPTDKNTKQADQALNTIYRKIIHSDFSDDRLGSLTADGFKITQRKWLKYRDAWVAFGVLHYKNTTSDVWITWTTKARTQELNKILLNF